MDTGPHKITVEGIGEFAFRRRTLGDQMRIEGDSDRMLGGPVSDPGLRGISLALATLGRLTEMAPEGWDIEAVDPLDENAVARILKVHEALRAAEDEFRRQRREARTRMGA